MLTRTFTLLVLAASLATGAHAQKAKKAAAPAHPYKDPSAPLAVRVNDLLGRMTLEEKAAQLQCYWLQKTKVMTKEGAFDSKQASALWKNGLGHFARVNEGAKPITGSISPEATVKLANQIQRHFVEKTRLGIPVLFHEESLHGNQAQGATNFPTPIALANSFNPELFGLIYETIAKEVRFRGGHQVLAPVVDIARDPRWGRTEECLGEDPYLTSRLAVAAIRAYQGNANGDQLAPIDQNHVAATMKHFGIHGIPEAGMNIGPAFLDERTAREVFLPSFKAAVQEGGVASVMPAYNEWSGVPAHGNSLLLRDILRKEWGFKGVVVSDYFAINELRTLHKLVAPTDTGAAAALALTSGVDIELPDPLAYAKLPELVRSGRISAALVDTSVANILRLKFRLGLFEKPYVDEKLAEQVVGSPPHRLVAVEAARQSMVLLKNEGNVLPFQPGKYRTIAVIGPNADRTILGGYSHTPRQVVTPLQGIKQLAGANTKVVYAEGVRLTDKGDWFSDPVIMSSDAENRKRIAEAISLAKSADAVVLCLGGNEALSREAWSNEHMGDLADLRLRGLQDELVSQILALKKPTSAFVFSGQPLAINQLAEQVPAVVYCFYLGQETGTAVAEALFGTTNPSGKLSMSIPRSAGHLPNYYAHKPTARRGYLLDTAAALYPFGHGLSYTTFKLGQPVLSTTQIPAAKLAPVTVTVPVTNSGSRAGSEVVQVYIRHQYASVTRPVKELKAFQRVTLAPGETKEVKLELVPDAFKFYNLRMQWLAEPHPVDIMVGTSSQDLPGKLVLELTK